MITFSVLAFILLPKETEQVVACGHLVLPSVEPPLHLALYRRIDLPPMRPAGDFSFADFLCAIGVAAADIGHSRFLRSGGPDGDSRPASRPSRGRLSRREPFRARNPRPIQNHKVNKFTLAMRSPELLNRAKIDFPGTLRGDALALGNLVERHEVAIPHAQRSSRRRIGVARRTGRGSFF